MKNYRNLKKEYSKYSYKAIYDMTDQDTTKRCFVIKAGTSKPRFTRLDHGGETTSDI